jgi:hypothetical protein
VIGADHQLWRIEHAFRMSKHDLRAQPVYHHKHGVVVICRPESLGWTYGSDLAGGTISRLRILPVAVFGSASTIHTRRGYLYAATCPLTCSRSSSAVRSAP